MSANSPACMVAASISPTLLKLLVSLISTAVFLRASKLKGSQSVCIQLSDPSLCISTYKATLDKEFLDLSIVSPEYYSFANVFSESQANTLTSHYLYNLKIYLDEEISSL